MIKIIIQFQYQVVFEPLILIKLNYFEYQVSAVEPDMMMSSLAGLPPLPKSLSGLLNIPNSESNSRNRNITNFGLSFTFPQ